MPKNDRLHHIVAAVKALPWTFGVTEDNEHHAQLINRAEERELSGWAIFMGRVVSDELSGPPEEWVGVTIERKQDAPE